MSLPIWVPETEVQDFGPDNTYRWATVTDTNPLRIRLDGDTVGLPMTPDTIVDPATLAIGNRVWVQLFGRRLIVIGKAGGAGVGAGGLLGIVTQTAASATTTSTTGTDVAGLSISFEAKAGHTYRATLNARGRSTVSGDTETILIRDQDDVDLGGFHYLVLPSSSNAYSFVTQALDVNPPAGPRTHKVAIYRASGTGAVSLHASTTGSPIRYYVEDLGVTPV